MTTLIFCKQRGSREDDAFRGTYAGPGQFPGEWDFVTRNQKLADMKINFRVVEAKDLKSFELPFTVKATPHLQLGDRHYEGRLTEKAIVEWVQQELNVERGADEKAPDMISAPVAPTAAKSQSAPNHITAPSAKVSTLIGGGILVAACAFAGAVAGFILSREDPDDEVEPLLLLNNDGKEVDFKSFWEPRPPQILNPKTAPTSGETDHPLATVQL